MHGIVCYCTVLNIFALYCIVLHGHKLLWYCNYDLDGSGCDIGVLKSENMKKLPALRAGSILAHFGIKSPCRS